MSETIQDLYTSFSEQMEPIQEDSRYFRYLFEMAQASGTTIEQQLARCHQHHHRKSAPFHHHRGRGGAGLARQKDQRR